MKIKIKEVATELGKSSKEIIEICKEIGISNVKAATSSITPQDAMKISEYINNPKPKEEPKKEEEKPKIEKSDDVKEKKSSSKMWMFAAIALIVVGIAGYFFIQKNTSSSNSVLVSNQKVSQKNIETKPIIKKAKKEKKRSLSHEER